METLNENQMLCHSHYFCRSVFLVSFTDPLYIYIYIYTYISLLFRSFVKSMMINKIWCKKAVEFSVFSIFSLDILLHFYELIRVVPLKYLIYFLASINTK